MCIRSQPCGQAASGFPAASITATTTRSSRTSKLASIFELYIKRDFELSAAQAGAGRPTSRMPDLFVPEEEEAPERVREPPQFFKPLRLNREVSVQPLLTPDNYAENALS